MAGRRQRTEYLRPVRRRSAPARTGRPYVNRVLSTERDYFDYNLLAIVILLTCFGLVMLYSTSAYEAMLEPGGDDMSYFRKQAVISVGAFVLALFSRQRQKGVSPVHTFERSDHGEPGHILCRAAA